MMRLAAKCKSALISALAASIAVAPAIAETIFVKYRGTVDLAPFRCEWIENSSLVRRLCYDRKNEYLIVSLNGTYYHYCGLPAAVLKDWVSAPSLGRFYNATIKHNFDCRQKLPPAY